MNQRQIVYITSSHNPFDTRIFQKECHSLTSAGFSVTLIAPWHQKKTTQNNVTVIGFKKAASRLGRLIKLMTVFFIAIKLPAQAYHVHEPELLALLPLFRIFRKQARFIYDVHENYADAIISPEKHWIPLFVKPWLAGFINAIEKALARSADLVVAAAPDIEERFSRCSTISVRNFAPMHLIDPAFAAKNQKPDAGKFEIVYTGSLTRTRGILEIVQSLSLIDPSIDITFKVSGWFYEKELQEQVEAEPGYKKVMFLGRIPDFKDMLKAIANADVAMMCFHPDPNLDNSVERSNKLFEYLGLGIPVIVSNLPVWSEMITRYQCGLTVDPLRPDDIAEKITIMAQDRIRFAEYGMNGRNAVLQYFNWETEGKKLVDAYNQLLQ